jgi:hypothetical protein
MDGVFYIGDMIRLDEKSYPQYKGIEDVLIQEIDTGYWEVFINGQSHNFRINERSMSKL